MADMIQRYDILNHPVSRIHADMVECENGVYVKYADVEAELTRLQERLSKCSPVLCPRCSSENWGRLTTTRVQCHDCEFTFTQEENGTGKQEKA